MALEQKLSLKLAQKLVMTPSLQQAIKLLQMTRIELEGVLTQELEENPILEEGEEPEESEESGEKENAEQESGEQETAPQSEEEPPKTKDDLDHEEAMNDIDLDAYFNDYLGSESQVSTYEDRERVPIENTLTREPDLYEHLLWQLHMLDLDPKRREIAELIIGNLDPEGFLVATLEEIQAMGNGQPDIRVATEEEPDARQDARQEGEEAAPQAPTAEMQPLVVDSENGRGAYSLEEVQAALEVVQSLDPPGIACHDLRESLLLQLKALEEEDSLSYRVIEESWDLFLKRQVQAIAKVHGVSLSDLKPALELIRSLETRPGRQFNIERTHYVEPDVVVVKVGEEYVIQLNDDGLPRLRVSKAYRRMLSQMRHEGRESAAQQFIREKMRSAVWLIKSLDQRQRTIYKVADSIVHQQREFLDKGIEHLRPMVLRDVAEDIAMHESTVSRVVSNKYIHTPRGLFPMKFFFHSGIDREYGEDISSLTVKRKIKQLIAM
jgi:RNA polymerase sigma-54 factor